MILDLGYLVGIAIFATLLVASAGPPYVTYDPAPTDICKWEVYGFGSGKTFDGGHFNSALGTERLW